MTKSPAIIYDMNGAYGSEPRSSGGNNFFRLRNTPEPDMLCDGFIGKLLDIDLITNSSWLLVYICLVTKVGPRAIVQMRNVRLKDSSFERLAG